MARAGQDKYQRRYLRYVPAVGNLIGNNPGGSWGGVYFDDTSSSNNWATSAAKSWCGTFLTNVFPREQYAILPTTKDDEYYVSTSSTHGDPFEASANILNGDKIFFLSAEEAESNSYGFVDDRSRIAYYESTSRAGYWWLRSPYNRDVLVLAGLVDHAGNVFYNEVDDGNAARPAFNLNLQSVLFSSAAEGGKSPGAGGDGTLNQVSTTSPSEWKLTLLDDGTVSGLDGHTGFSAQCVTGAPGTQSATSATVEQGKQVTLSYSGAKTTKNECVSAILKDSTGKILYYGNLEKTAGGSEASPVTGVPLTIPSTVQPGTYILGVFAEQCNGDKKTDYASKVSNISLTVTAPAPAPVVDATKTDVKGLTAADIPQSLKDAGYDTPEKIGEALLKVVVSKGGAGAQGGSGSGHVLLEVKLMVSFDGGVTWTEATQQNFPAEGVKAVLPYPSGTGKDTHRFTVVHMFTENFRGHKPGETETPAVTLTDKGIEVVLDGLSPVLVSWEKKEASRQDSSDIGSSQPAPAPDPVPELKNGWENGTAENSDYWYINGVRAGTADDPDCVSAGGISRGREIQDPATKKWYWLDADKGGKKAKNKWVMVPYFHQNRTAVNSAHGETFADNGSIFGKWVYYGDDGQMLKGWQSGIPTGNDPSSNETATYYFDPATGAVARGVCSIEENGVRKLHRFDPVTGVYLGEVDPAAYGAGADDGDAQEVAGAGGGLAWQGNGTGGTSAQETGGDSDGDALRKTGKRRCLWDYWYENGILQGVQGSPWTEGDVYRGKEIYDPQTDAWYWLDECNGGRKAVGKDVYHPYVFSDEVPGATKGKWVRYDEDGHMVKGWDEDETGRCFFDLVTGAMYKGIHEIDGTVYDFDEVTGRVKN